jgi:hypothetical protein
VSSGTLTNRATVSSHVPDPQISDNSVTLLVPVMGGPGNVLSAVLLGDTLVVAWPLSTNLYRLQFTASLAPPNWQVVNQGLATNNYEIIFTAVPGAQSGFYRLIKSP